MSFYLEHTFRVQIIKNSTLEAHILNHFYSLDLSYYVEPPFWVWVFLDFQSILLEQSSYRLDVDTSLMWLEFSHRWDKSSSFPIFFEYIHTVLARTSKLCQNLICKKVSKSYTFLQTNILTTYQSFVICYWNAQHCWGLKGVLRTNSSE